MTTGTALTLLLFLSSIANGATIPEMIEALGSPSEATRNTAKAGLVQQGANAVEPVLNAIVATNASTRRIRLGLDILREIGSDSASAIPRLLQFLATDSRHRSKILDIIRAAGTDNARAQLQATIAGNHVSAKNEAIMIIHRYFDNVRDAVPFLQTHLVNTEPSTRISTIRALTSLLDDFRVQERVSTILAGVGEEAIPYLIGLAGSNSQQSTRIFALRALEQMGENAIGSLNRLFRLHADTTSSTDRDVRGAIEQAIAHIAADSLQGQNPQRLVNILHRAYDHSEFSDQALSQLKRLALQNPERLKPLLASIPTTLCALIMTR